MLIELLRITIYNNAKNKLHSKDTSISHRPHFRILLRDFIFYILANNDKTAKKRIFYLSVKRSYQSRIPNTNRVTFIRVLLLDVDNANN